MILIFPLIFFLFVTPANAHKPSDSYLTLTVAENKVSVRWDIALRDLEDAIGLDQNGDGAITWGELRNQHGAIAAYALPRIRIDADTATCLPQEPNHLIDEHTDGAYAVLQFQAVCPHSPRQVDIAYQLLFDLNPQHRGLLRLTDGNETRMVVFSPDQNRYGFERMTTSPSPVRQFLDFGREGFGHFLIGFDHILFLLTLLLPAALCRQGKRWGVVQSFREMALNTIKVVTAFTLAHSLTLSLATLGIIDLPARGVEAIIALSVMISAINNLYPLFQNRFSIAFIFGLVHGCGLAGRLLDFGLAGTPLLVALAGFNIGVEVGQLAIVALFLPLAYSLRRSRFYQPAGLVFGSLLITVFASLWLIERILNIKLL